MKKIIPIVIIDFNSYGRTITYIEDFINKVLINNDISFIIVDTSEDNNNYKCFKDELFKKFEVNRLENIETNNVDRIVQIEKYECSNINKLVDIIHVKSKKNYGFAIANNIGANIAKKMYKIDYILFSNSDIKFCNKLNLNKMLSYFIKDEKIALIGPKVIGLDNKNQSPCKKLSLWKRWNFNSLIWPLNSIIRIKMLNTYDDLIDTNQNCYAYRIIGAFMIFDFNKFEKIGMFDEGTFLYAEELIIAEKLRYNHYKTFYVNDEKLIHEQGGSVKKKFNNYESLKNKFISEIYYYRKYINVNKLRILVSKLLFNIYVYKLKIVYRIRDIKLLNNRGEN